RAERDVPVANEKGSLRLGNSTAARIRKIAGQQNACDERAADRDDEPAPRGATGWEQAGRQVLGKENEGYHHQADYRPDDEGQNQENAFLALKRRGRVLEPGNWSHRGTCGGITPAQCSSDGLM